MENIIDSNQTKNTTNYDYRDTLSDHYEKAQLPDYEGIAADVLNSLGRQIGKGPLSITQVSEDLKISGRTLQRHLQKESISFYEIREKLRHNKAIAMLMSEQKSIKGIYLSLGYTDRTGFSKAFKRWTGLAPDVFRRLYKEELNESALPHA